MHFDPFPPNSAQKSSNLLPSATRGGKGCLLDPPGLGTLQLEQKGLNPKQAKLDRENDSQLEGNTQHALKGQPTQRKSRGAGNWVGLGTEVMERLGGPKVSAKATLGIEMSAELCR